MNNNAYKVLDPSFSVNSDRLIIHKSNSFEHELAKFLVYWENISNNNRVITEARFKGGLRADLFNVTTNTAIEIIKSEGKESIERKKVDYPVDVIFLEADKVIKYWINKLEKFIKFKDV